MRAIVLPRVAGKTQRMLNWLISDKRHVLIVFSARERDRLVKLLKEEDATHDEMFRVVAISEFVNGLTRGRWRDPIYGIDELDQVLFALFHGPVAVVSFTGEIDSTRKEHAR